MPYFITVLVLVVLSVGFTLFQSQSTVAQTADEPLSIESAQDMVRDLIEMATNTPPVVNTDLTNEVTIGEPVLDTAVPAPKATTQEPVTNSIFSHPTPTNTNDFTNGTYHTQTSYRTPDGTYQMDVTLTISDDKITAANLGFDSKGARDGYSKRFSSSYESQIIGQDLGTASLSRVGGASLTTRAFNNAIDAIQAQAT